MSLYTPPGFGGIAVSLIYLLNVRSYFVERHDFHIMIVFYLNQCSTSSIPPQNNSESTKVVFQKDGTEYKERNWIVVGFLFVLIQYQWYIDSNPIKVHDVFVMTNSSINNLIFELNNFEKENQFQAARSCWLF